MRPANPRVDSATDGLKPAVIGELRLPHLSPPNRLPQPLQAL